MLAREIGCIPKSYWFFTQPSLYFKLLLSPVTAYMVMEPKRLQGMLLTVFLMLHPLKIFGFLLQLISPCHYLDGLGILWNLYFTTLVLLCQTRRRWIELV